MHGGAIASAIDVATTAAIVSTGTFPGVSASLGVSYLAGCAPGEELRLVATVLKAGARLAFTDARLYGADGRLLARGHHLKFVEPPSRLIGWLLRLRPSVSTWLLERLIARRQSVRVGSRELRFGDKGRNDDKPPGDPLHRPFDPHVEGTTGLPRDDAGKREYFAQYGRGKYPFGGWDAPLGGALEFSGPAEEQQPPPSTPDAPLLEAETAQPRHDPAASWSFTVGPRACAVALFSLPSSLHCQTTNRPSAPLPLPASGHRNTFGALHGGCTASLVDVLGTAAIALDNPLECGVALSLEVEYASAAKTGDKLVCTAEHLKRGGRIAAVEVRILTAGRDRRGRGGGRLVAVGTVTKSLRGLSTSAGASGKSKKAQN
jgi:acyl-coenzyme A thioesterase 13